MKTQLRRLFVTLYLLAFFSMPVSAESGTLVPVGRTVGLELETDGVYVSRMDEAVSPAKDAGLKEGDRILRVNGSPLAGAEELRTAVANGGGQRLILDVERCGKAMSFTVRPATTNHGWALGVYLQDRISGLGTVTFYDPDTGGFGALGHGVNEAGSSRPMAVLRGKAVDAEITAVQKGTAGTPGCLKGSSAAGHLLGTVEENTPQGIFGHTLGAVWTGSPLPVADHSEITTGPAEIWSNISGSQTEHYQVMIEGLSFDRDSCRNLRLVVTDPRLLEQTGGIVQGMSGSPIIQNGRLIGAVTHVLIQDPTRGYGIFIENMLAASQQGEEAA